MANPSPAPFVWTATDLLAKRLIESLRDGTGRATYEALISQAISPAMLCKEPAKGLLEAFLASDGRATHAAITASHGKNRAFVDYVGTIFKETPATAIPSDEFTTFLKGRIVKPHEDFQYRQTAKKLLDMLNNPSVDTHTVRLAIEDLAASDGQSDEDNVLLFGDLRPRFDTLMANLQAGQLEVEIVRTRLAALDNVILGLGRGEVTFILGDTGSGKSSAGLEIVLRCGEDGLGGLICNGEMGDLDTYHRGVNNRSGVPNQLQLTNQASAEDWERVRNAADLMDSLPIGINENPTLTIPSIRKWFRKTLIKLQSRFSRPIPIDIIVIDYARLIEGVKAANEIEAADKIGRELKNLVKTLKNPDGSRPAMLVIWDSNRSKSSAGRIQWHTNDVWGASEKHAATIIAFSNLRKLVLDGHRVAVENWILDYNTIHPEARLNVDEFTIGVFRGGKLWFNEDLRVGFVIKHRSGTEGVFLLNFIKHITAWDDLVSTVNRPNDNTRPRTEAEMLEDISGL